MRVDNPGGRREVQLTFDPVAMASYNISNQAVTSALGSLNRSTSTGASFKVGTDEYDIVIMDDLTEEEEEAGRWEKTMDDLRRVIVTDANGGTHELQQIANIRLFFLSQFSHPFCFTDECFLYITSYILHFNGQYI